MSNNQHHDWDKLFDQLPLDATVRDEQREQLKSDALEVFDNEQTPPTRKTTLQTIGHTLMKYKAPHWTTATVLIAGMFWMFQSSSDPAFAVDALVENMMKVKTARYDIVTNVDGLPTQKMKAFFLEPTHMRQEMPGGYINISDWTAGKMIGLNTKTKQATVFNLMNISEEAKKGMQYGNQFEVLRQSLQAATTDPNSKVVPLGEKQLNGRTVIGIRFENPGMPMTLWADPETQYPVRIESTMVGPPKTKLVMKNYEFNVELDESLFSLEIPDGYEVIETDIDASPAIESDFITALRMCCEAADGEFPTGLDTVSIGKYSAMYLQHIGADLEKGPTGKQLQEIVKLARGFQFVAMLPKESNAHYAGTGTKQGDKQRAIFWFKPADSEKYRVVFADLTIKESDEPPEVTGAVKLSK